MGGNRADVGAEARRATETRHATSAPLRRFVGAILVTALLAGGLSVIPPARGADFTPGTPDALLTDVATANTNMEADIIDLGGQTFTLTAPLTITPDTANPANTLTIRNGTLQRTDDGGRVLEIQSDAVVYLEP